MIRVLHVINWFRRGGIETQLLRILRDYDRSRFHMDVCCIGSEEGYLAEEARSYGAEILMCPKSVNVFSFSSRFAKTIKSKEYDIVHIQGSPLWGGALARGAHKAGVPVSIVHLRSTHHGGRATRSGLVARLGASLLYRLGKKWASKYTHAILGVSEATFDAQYPNWRSNTRKQFITLTGGVDTKVFSPKKQEDSDTANKVIVSVGSFTKEKNQRMLIDIFARILKQIPNAKLMLIGEGRKLANVKQMAKDNGTFDSIEFAGLRNDISNILRAADVYISPSKLEGLPNVLLEAQAVGLPVVASDIPPHHEVLAPELHPFIFSLNDPQRASDGIVKVLKDKELSATLRKAGRDYIVKHYDYAKALKRLENLYEAWMKKTE